MSIIAIINVGTETKLTTIENIESNTETINVLNWEISMTNTTKSTNIEEMEIVARIEEIKPGYEYDATHNRYRKKLVTGQRPYAKKSEAVSIREVWEYTSKKSLVRIRKDHSIYMEDEATLKHQESMSTSVEANEYHIGPQPIRDVEHMPVGTKVVIQALPVERMEIKRRKTIDSFTGKANVEVRYFKMRDDTGEMWVKPGFKVFMKDGEFQTIHGEIIRLPISINNYDAIRFLPEIAQLIKQDMEEIGATEQEIVDRLNKEGYKHVTMLTFAKFVKYVPADITGKTDSEVELTDEEFVKRVFKGYEYDEVMDPNDYSRMPMGEDLDYTPELRRHISKLYGWEGAMIRMKKAKYSASYSERGGGIEDMYGRLVDAEENISNILGEEGLKLVQRLAKFSLTGDQMVDVSFVSDGSQNMANAEVLYCIREVEEWYFQKERQEVREPAYDRLHKHVTYQHVGEEWNVTGGFLTYIYKLQRDWRQAIIDVIEFAKKRSIEINLDVNRKQWNPDLKKDVKIHEMADGLEWYENTVAVLLGEMRMLLKDKLNIRFIHETIDNGLKNIASMLMRNEVVPMRKSEIIKAITTIEAKAEKKKFYGGAIGSALWRYFSIWQEIKRAEEIQATGEGHVDEEVAGGSEVEFRKKRAQIDAEARDLRYISWKFDRE